MLTRVDLVAGSGLGLGSHAGLRCTQHFVHIQHSALRLVKVYRRQTVHRYRNPFMFHHLMNAETHVRICVQ